MKKAKMLIHGGFLASMCAIVLVALISCIFVWGTGVADGGLNYLNYLFLHCFLALPILCLVYELVALWLHSTGNVIARIVRSLVILIAVGWILTDFLCWDFFMVPKPEEHYSGLENLRILDYYFNSMRFNYFVVVVLMGFWRITELFFPCSRKERGTWAWGIPSALAIGAGIGVFLCVFIAGLGIIFLVAALLPFTLSLYVLYGSLVNLFLTKPVGKRKRLFLLTSVFAGTTLLSLIFPVLWGMALLFNVSFYRLIAALFPIVLSASFFAQWALGVLQRSLEANWEKEDREKEQAAQEQEVQAFPAEQESEALPAAQEASV